MKLKFTHKTWYFFLLCAAAASMLNGFAAVSYTHLVILPHSCVRLQQTVGNVAVNLLHIAEGCMGNFHVMLLHLCCSLNCANALAASTVSPF